MTTRIPPLDQMPIGLSPLFRRRAVADLPLRERARDASGLEVRAVADLPPREQARGASALDMCGDPALPPQAPPAPQPALVAAEAPSGTQVGTLHYPALPAQAGTQSRTLQSGPPGFPLTRE